MRKNFKKVRKWGIAGVAVIAAIIAPIVYGSFTALPPGAILPIEFRSPVSMEVGSGLHCTIESAEFTGDGYTIHADCPAPTQTDEPTATAVDQPIGTEEAVTPYPFPTFIEATAYP